jgi:UDP-N-acetylmuramate dehydrogenase
MIKEYKLAGCNVLTNHGLKHNNSLRIPTTARFYIAITSMDQLNLVHMELLNSPYPVFILGGGSNILCADTINAWVLHMQNRGIEWVPGAPKGKQWVKVSAGENWHFVVSSMVASGLSGIENLALIPGSAGAAPIQNIGAYGVEIADCLRSVEVYDLQTGRLEALAVKELHFGYRTSRFQSPPWRGRKVVWSLLLELDTQFSPQITYPALQHYFNGRQPQQVQEVMDAVISIRQAKLPDPMLTPNAGSFFKNPVVTKAKAEQLKSKFPHMVCYPLTDDQEKIAAGWLIDYLGFRGAWNDQNTVGCCDTQALVLVNNGGSAQEVLNWAHQIQQAVFETFRLELEIEPVQVS